MESIGPYSDIPEEVERDVVNPFLNKEEQNALRYRDKKSFNTNRLERLQRSIKRHIGGFVYDTGYGNMIEELESEFDEFIGLQQQIDQFLALQPPYKPNHGQLFHQIRLKLMEISAKFEGTIICTISGSFKRVNFLNKPSGNLGDYSPEEDEWTLAEWYTDNRENEVLGDWPTMSPSQDEPQVWDFRVHYSQYDYNENYVKEYDGSYDLEIRYKGDISKFDADKFMIKGFDLVGPNAADDTESTCVLHPDSSQWLREKVEFFQLLEVE